MRLRPSFRTLCSMLLLPALGWAAGEGPKPANPSAATALVHVNVIPMDRERVLADQTVLVENGRFTQIGPSKTIHLRPGVRRIEAKGKYLIPGLTDAHVHLQSQIEFPVYLANGVTTLLNLDGRPAHLLWRKQVASGEVVGPTIFSTGPIFHQKRTAEEDVKLVDEQAAAGYDAIKVYNEVSKEEYPALIVEARRKNLLLMGHVARGPGFAMTLESGQSIAHLEEVVYTNFNPKNDDDFEHIVFDDSKIPALARQIKNANIYVTATLNNFSLIVQQATGLDTFLKNPELKYVPPWTLDNFQPANNRYKNRFAPELYPVLENMLALQRKLLKALSDQGVPLMAGTDATEIGPVAGFGLPHELEEFVHDGLTPYQALESATTTPARYLRQSSEFGSITAGKRADMVLLSGNPLSDISNTEKIAGVMVRGRWLDAKELADVLQTVPDQYRREEQRVEAMFEKDPGQASAYLAERDPLGRLTAYAIGEVAGKQSVDDLMKMLKAMRSADPKAEMVSEDSINNLGYALINQKLYPQAMAVLTLNTENHPASANTWDSLADAFFHSGDVSKALDNYRKALATDGSYANADGAKKFIGEHGPK